MLRSLTALAGVAAATAIRRNAAVNDPESNDGLRGGAMGTIFSLLEQHTSPSVAERGLAMARSLEEMALTTMWTNGVKGNLSDVVARLQEDVVKRIELGHNETQQKLNAEVSILNTKATKAASSKTAANQADKTLQTCVTEELAAMQKIVDAEDLYNEKTDERVEPCQREKDTAKFSVSSDGPVTAECDTDTDPTCSAAIADLERQLQTLKEQVAGRLDDLAAQHKTAETDCKTAVDAQTAQLEVVKEDQSSWVTTHSECAGKELQRDTKICVFGEKFQEVCEAKTVYDGLVASTQQSGNTNSVEDRISEWKVAQLVVCLLDRFQQGANLTDDSVEECQNSISTSRFDLDLKAGEVQTILEVPASPSFQISCKDSEAISFHGGVWSVPSVPNPPKGYDGQVPSAENATLPKYLFNPSWSLNVSLGAESPPFALTECSAAADNSSPVTGPGTGVV